MQSKKTKLFSLLKVILPWIGWALVTYGTFYDYTVKVESGVINASFFWNVAFLYLSAGGSLLAMLMPVKKAFRHSYARKSALMAILYLGLSFLFISCVIGLLSVYADYGNEGSLEMLRRLANVSIGETDFTSFGANAALTLFFVSVMVTYYAWDHQRRQARWFSCTRRTGLEHVQQLRMRNKKLIQIDNHRND